MGTKEIERLKKDLEKRKKELQIKKEVAILKKEIEELSPSKGRKIGKDLFKGAKIIGRGLGKSLKGGFKLAATAGRNIEKSQRKVKRKKGRRVIDLFP